MNISAYISELNRQYASGNATEHSYRPALKSLSETLLPDLTIINEPKRTACGAPDYILLRNDIPVAFIEAKISLRHKTLRDKRRTGAIRPL